MRLNIIELFFLIIFILIPFTTSPAQQEYISAELLNGDFELKENNKPKNWHFYGPNKVLTIDAEIFYKGSYSVKLNLIEESNEEVYLVQTVEVEASKLYEIAGFIKSEKLENGYAGIIVIFQDIDGNILKQYNLPYVTKTQNWIYQSKWIRSPKNSDIALIKCLTKGVGIAWFDDIYFSSTLRGGY